MYAAAAVNGVVPEDCPYPAQRLCRYPMLLRAYFFTQIKHKQLWTKFFEHGIFILAQLALKKEIVDSWKLFRQRQNQLERTLNPYVKPIQQESAETGNSLMTGWKRQYGDWNSPEMQRRLKLVTAETNRILRRKN